MECRAAIEYINMYVDNMLSDSEVEQLLSHLRECKSCKKELDDITALKNALLKLDELEPPVGLAKAAVKKAKRHRIPIFAYATAGVAAVIALVAVFSTGLLNSQDGGKSEQKISYSAQYNSTAEDEMENFDAVLATSEPAGEAAPAAPQECATLEAAAGADGVEKGSVRQADDMSAFLITVFPEYSESVRQQLGSYIEKYDIEIEQTDNKITFNIPKEHIAELESILNDTGIEYGDTLTGVQSVEFIFE